MMQTLSLSRHSQVARVALLFAAAIVLVLGFLVPPIFILIAVCTILGVLLTLRYPVAGIVLFTFSVPWGSGFSLPLGSFPVTTTDVLVAALGAAWLVAVVLGRAAPSRIWTPYILLFVGAICLSVTQAVDTHASLREIVKWLETAIVFWSAATFIRSRNEVRMVVVALVLAGVSQALLGYIQFLFHLGPEEFAAHRAFLRAFGTFDQPNPFAGYLNMIWPFAAAMGLVAERGSRRLLYLLTAAFMVGAILASESRGALLAGMLAGTVLLALLSRPLRGWVWTGVLALLGGAWLATFGLVPSSPFQRLLRSVGLADVSFTGVTNANYSAIERAAHWLAGVRMFAAHPVLGVGIGNYEAAYPAYHPRGWYLALAHAHNYYINIAAEAGVVGLAAYILLVGSALWYSYAAMRLVRDVLYRAAVLGVIGALVATSFHNVFDVLYVHGMVALLGLLMALVAVALRDGGADSSQAGVMGSGAEIV